MEAVGLSTCALPPADIITQILCRVTSTTLDPCKHWYLLSKEVCGVPARKFFKRDVFKIFPDEIHSVAARELQPAKSSNGVVELDRIPEFVSVVSTFGLVAGLLRNRTIPDELINCAGFMAIINLVNSATLDFELECAKNSSFGAKLSQDSEEFASLLVDRSARVNSLEEELKKLQTRISDLESSMESDNFSFNSPCCSSTPLSSSSSSCSSIEDTKNRSDLGTTNKKRQILKRCREIRAVLDDVSERYNESIAAVLGNSFLYGTDGERERVQGIISEVVDLVTKSKGSKNVLTELLLPETLENVFQSIRVPDWVLLFFKLLTRLPDSAWQTLLNLTRLGKSGVSC
ncbi:uncharacterized protein LOC111344507 [Stylophora pistillata]|uniref:uncharacterized protein LOC111344507 n=1 Tax=Stylophora pistillata TaxID=50429 RepID=UPI000C057B50|nr:uncharacterized protein LOC111344507 [Stylophora pistillata]